MAGQWWGNVGNDETIKAIMEQWKGNDGAINKRLTFIWQWLQWWGKEGAMIKAMVAMMRQWWQRRGN
jgi:hypothetical protein